MSSIPLLTSLLLILLLASAAVLAWQGVQLRRARVAQGDHSLRPLARHNQPLGWVLDCRTTQLVYLGPVAAAWFGAEPARLDRLAAELAQGLPAALATFLAPSQAQPTRPLDQDGIAGSPLAIDIESTLVADEQGRPAWLVGVLRDVSEQRSQELEHEELQQHQAELERTQKKFASMVSHEFRTPLATIDGAIQRLEMTADSAGADEATRKRYRKIQLAVDRLLQMLDEYLSPERMAALGRKRAPDGLDPRALLEQVVAEAQSPRHPLSLRTDRLPASVRCDPDGMRLCLQVLLDNAARYTPDGAPIEVVGQAAPEGGIEMLVLDSGPGLLDDEIRKLFDKFFRGRDAVGQTGSGLGLYMARSVIEVSGGSLTASNRAQGGAQFRIWLPFPAVSGKNLALGECNSDNSLTQDSAASLNKRVNGEHTN